MVTTSVRRHLRELRAALRVVVSVVATLLLVAVRAGRPRGGPATPVARARSLVVLVHGFGAGPGCFDAVVPALGGPGVAVVAHRYSWTGRVGTLGEQLADEVTDLVRRSGARSVTLVGHSLGGVIVAASLPRLDGVVTRVVTVAAPLGGTRWARLFPVGAVRDLRPGSPALRTIADAPRRPASWTAVASRADVVVAVDSATPRAARAVVVDGVGHCGLLRDADVIARLAALARHGRSGRARTRAVVLPDRPVAARPALALAA
ncbi:alpha/beta fold hydrolase [Actinomycetospora lemnae]|uniref:Alpha/beta fold hydrolase n=1 Tax=Actinomycetospora lemnae TaxID=3019891 RepID=A0ABT5T526_9PSEU|nr:alpha/beta fold hydrolase [Actinomycetospora sp. DW7H6]MDD7969018.1 alpha/beta fold hydrolase [Actinomycetospora sp. DW7H6]